MAMGYTWRSTHGDWKWNGAYTAGSVHVQMMQLASNPVCRVSMRDGSTL